MLEIDNRKVDLTPELLKQLGEPKRMPNGSEAVAVERGGFGCWNGSVEDYYRIENLLIQNARREGVKHEAFLLFENGRVRI